MSHINDIIAKIEQQISNSDLSDKFDKKGEILEIKDGVANVSGLEGAMYSEIVSFANGSKGLILDLLKDQVGILILGNPDGLEPGQLVESTGQVFSISVGEKFLGRVVDGLGNPIDGHGDIKGDDVYPVERKAPGVMTRQSVDVPLETGIKAIDNMVPIGRGQRELIIGDRQTGKTAVAIDTILNQKNTKVKCIYVAIGQKEAKVARLAQTLKEKGAMDYTVIVNAPANSPAVLQYMAPYVGCALGEYFMHKGEDALIIYDDLSKHAIAYREMSLLLRRPPGREAYPGDVFYLHSKLLERAANLNEKNGGGSLTALPIIETNAGDVSAYIPTNVISITDGQIFLSSDLFNAGIRPAINVGTSVSRVGGSAQTGIMKKVSGKLKLYLAQYRELEAFSQFGSDLDKETKKVLDRGSRLVEMLKQDLNSPIPFYKQIVTTYAGINGFLDNIAVEKVGEFEQTLYNKLDGSHKELKDQIISIKKLTDEIEEGIKSLVAETVSEFA